MFGSLLDLAVNTVRVVAAPVELVLDVANEVVKPVADTAEELANDIRSIFD